MHPVLIRIGPLTLSTYGVLVAAAYLTGILWLKARIAEMPRMTEDKFWTLIYGVFFGALAGGKLLYVAVEWRAFASGELGVLRDFRYGFVFFGGLIGALGAGAWLRRRLDIPFLATADYFGVALPLSHWIGRLGCLAAGCCYGRPTSLPWGVRLGGDPASSTPAALWDVPLHPAQLYEAAWDLAIALLLWKAVLPRVKDGRLPRGSVFFGYAALYACGRFVIEFFRGDPRGGGALGLSVSQWLALAALLACGASVERLRKRRHAAAGP
jgi:phosphatidylglycerol---prolipoprotein diacylglyceryl transferase